MSCELDDYRTIENDVSSHTMITATCALFNARSLNIKLSDLHELRRRNYCMVFVTESWLRNSIVDGHIDNTDRFHIYRKDRSDRIGGGVYLFQNHTAHMKFFYQKSSVYLR